MASENDCKAVANRIVGADSGRGERGLERSFHHHFGTGNWQIERRR